MRSLTTAEAQDWCSQSEAEDALSFVTLGVLFLWDVHVLGSSGKRYLLYSHDEIVDVAT